MLNRLLGIAFIGAVVAQALVLPHEKDTPVVRHTAHHKARSIHLPCRSCISRPDRILEDDEHRNDRPSSRDESNHVNLSFGISDDGRRLEFGGHPVYPSQLLTQAYLDGPYLRLEQVSPSGQATPFAINLAGLKIESEERASNEGNAVIFLKLRIAGSEMLRADGVAEIGVAVDLLRTTDGELFILALRNLSRRTLSPLPIAPGDSNDARQCGFLPSAVCQLERIVEEKITAFRSRDFGSVFSCLASREKAHHLPSRIRPVSRFAEADHEGHRGSDRSRLVTSSQGQNYRQGRLQALIRGLLTIVIPILAGIAVGLIVSFFGLILGQLIGWLWIRFVRGDRHRYARRIRQWDREKILVDGESFEFLPPYEHAPEYQEIDGDPR